MEGFDRSDDPKANALYTLTLDRLTVCHMGDVGNPLTERQLASLRGRVDVLLALAGATLTIALPDLDRAIEEIGPRLVIPMHYRTPRIRYDLGPLENFLARGPGDPVLRSGESTVEITPETLPQRRTSSSSSHCSDEPGSAKRGRRHSVTPESRCPPTAPRSARRSWRA
jgi:L-ascorbate metabolism protein UlaG (beta-lactamase superfamily)